MNHASLPDLSHLYDLRGKAALVTGGASGMGEEIARHLAAAGAAVAILDRDEAGAARHAAGLAALGAASLGLGADLADEAEIAAALDKAQAKFGALDILVNNAGVMNRQYLLETTAEHWDFLHQVNARGQFLCLREAGRQMRAAGKGGRIVNISSVGSLHPVMSGLAAYNASKAAVNELTRSAALELAPHGITVNAVLPGGVATAGSTRIPGPPPSGRVVEPTVLGAAVTVSDIAAMVLFLASPASAAITGQCFAVEAGYLLG